MHRHRILTRADETQAVARFSQTRSAADLAPLVESCLPWIYRQAARLARHTPVGLDDLVQAGAQGACEAAWRFDPDRGHRFLTYARPWIDCMMRQTLVRETVVRPQRVNAPGGGKQTTPVYVSYLDDLVNSHPITTRLERLEDSGPSPEEQVADAEAPVAAQAQVARLLEVLDARERRIIHMLDLRPPDGPRCTMDHVARELGVSREWVRVLRMRALERMRRAAEGDTTDAQAAT